jgi:hypothetical protein
MSSTVKVEIFGFVLGSERESRKSCISTVSSYMSMLGKKEYDIREVDSRQVGEGNDYITRANVFLAGNETIEEMTRRAKKVGLDGLNFLRA